MRGVWNNPRVIEPAHLQKFAAVFAEAVLTFLDSGEAQWVLWDGRSHQFDFSSVELDDPQLPAMLFVDASWPQALGDLNEVTDPEDPDFDMDALRNAIETLLLDEGYGERLLKGFQERLARIEAGEIDEDDDFGDAAEPEAE